MHRRFFLVALAACAIAACTASRQTVMESFRGATSCCRSMSEFRYEPVAPGETRGFDLDARSPAFRFPGGLSYFRAFALPPASAAYTVRVRSWLMGDELRSAYIFFPQVITLDAEFNVVRRLAPEAFELKRASYAESMKETWGMPWKLEGSLAFTGDNQAERYLVVFTTDELLARHTSLETLRITPIILPGIVTAVPVGKEKTAVPHAPAGHLDVSILQ